MKQEGANYKVWMERFDDYALRDVKSVQVKINYIHNNPVRKGLVNCPADYIYSSAAFYHRDQTGPVKVIHFMEALGFGSSYGYGQIRGGGFFQINCLE